MEKTKSQIIKYLSRRSYPDNEWKAILSFCNKKYGSGARRSLRPKCSSRLDDFMEWLQNGIGDGDIVSDADGKVGIYYNDGVKDYFAAHLASGKVVVEKGVCVNPSPVDKRTAEGFCKQMAEQGLVFRINFSSVTDINIPQPGSRCRVMYDGKVYIGVFLGVCGRDAVFAYLVCGRNLLRDISIDLWNLSFMECGVNDARKAYDILVENGLMYDKGAGELVEMTARQSRGGSYWYVSDRLTVVNCVDTGSMTHKARYECHNYFNSYDEADSIRRKLLEWGERLIKKGNR